MTAKPPRSYPNATAFRRALEDRLRRIAQTEEVDINRLRRQVAFDRLLARLFRSEAAPWMLKGGYALELWMKAARSTVDIDLTMPSITNTNNSNDAVREMLQTAASQQLGDWLEYLVGSPMLDLDAAPYGGARYPIEARMDARIFARFHLDVGIGDVVLFPLEELTGRNWLEFAGIERLRVKSISREQHFAEKLHAYTLPRSTPNSRVKDLVDMVLLIQSNSLDPVRAAEAIRLTFEHRNTHAIPSQLDAPPHDWNRQFAVLAKECELSLDIEGAFDVLRAFYDSAGSHRSCG